MPRSADGSVEPEDLEKAIGEAISTMTDQERKVWWARFTRPMANRSAPPFLLKAWDDCGTDRSKKNSLFEMYIGVGGQFGKLQALEEVIKTETDADTVELEWLTECQLIDLYKSQAKAKQVIKSRTQAYFF